MRTNAHVVCENSTIVTRENGNSINVAELLGMDMSAWMSVRLRVGSVLLTRAQQAPFCGDNESDVQWVKRYRGGEEPRSGVLVRVLGALELTSERALYSKLNTFRAF